MRTSKYKGKFIFKDSSVYEIVKVLKIKNIDWMNYTTINAICKKAMMIRKQTQIIGKYGNTKDIKYIRTYEPTQNENETETTRIYDICDNDYIENITTESL